MFGSINTPSPRRILAVGTLFALLLTWATIYLALQTPWLGLKLSPQTDVVIIQSVSPLLQSNASIPPSSTLIGLGQQGQEQIITAETLLEEPDYLPTYAAMNAFFEEQQTLFEQLQQNRVALHLQTPSGDSQTIQVHPQERPLFALPSLFWAQIAFGLLAFLTGLSVWAFRPENRAAQLYGLTGLGFLLITYPAAIYSSRELALNGDFFRALVIVCHFGSMSFSAAFVALFARYPRKLGPGRVPCLLFIGYSSVWLLDTLQWLPSTNWGIRIPMIVGLIVSLAFAAWQWHSVRNFPLQKAALKWFLLAVLFGGSSFVLMIFVVVLFGGTPVISQGYAFSVVLAMYIGVALGITRYRLFELERWWFKVWLWLIAGFMLLIVDLIFLHLLHLSDGMPLSLALAITGWAYFPARQWILEKFLPAQQTNLEALLPEIIGLMLAPGGHQHFQANIRKFMLNVFQPLGADYQLSQNLNQTQILDDGVVMVLPAINRESHELRLSYAAKGNRLFNETDAQLVDSVWHLLRQAQAHREAYEQGANAERERIARDLHDDLGSRLLTLVHRANNSEVQDIAREAMKDLRFVVSSLSIAARPLEHALADWRVEAQGNCDATDVELRWEQEGALEQMIDPTCQIHLRSILREAITNALKHAQTNLIHVTWVMTQDQISLEVLNNGASVSPENWPSGRGVGNIRRRVYELNGEADWTRREPDSIAFAIRLPFES